jgi:hypothetical protein
MKSAKKTYQRKAPAKALEYAGDWITGNYWIRIGLTNRQVRAITRLGKRWRFRKAPCATMARYLVSLALLSAKETQAKLEALTRYMEAEGFNSLGKYCDDVMLAQEKLVRK